MQTTTVLFLLALGLVKVVENTSVASIPENAKHDLAAAETARKRTLLEAVTPHSTIEYADDKTASPENYVTPGPQVVKISDVLTSNGIPYPAAIANHLVSPTSIYQPTQQPSVTYKVSAPIPAQLAYSEHKTYQPQFNAITYSPPQKPTIIIENQLLGIPQNVFHYEQPIPNPHQQENYQKAMPQHIYDALFNKPRSLSELIDIVSGMDDSARPEDTTTINHQKVATDIQQQSQTNALEEDQPRPKISLESQKGFLDLLRFAAEAESYASFSQSPPNYSPQRNSNPSLTTIEYAGNVRPTQKNPSYSPPQEQAAVQSTKQNNELNLQIQQLLSTQQLQNEPFAHYQHVSSFNHQIPQYQPQVRQYQQQASQYQQQVPQYQQQVPQYQQQVPLISQQRLPLQQRNPQQYQQLQSFQQFYHQQPQQHVQQLNHQYHHSHFPQGPLNQFMSSSSSHFGPLEQQQQPIQALFYNQPLFDPRGQPMVVRVHPNLPVQFYGKFAQDIFAKYLPK